MTTPAPASARERFADAVARPETEIDLAGAALLVAAEEYPQLSPEPYLQRLDVLAERVRDRLANENAPLIVLQELSRVLFEEEHFRGNAGNYYDPRNSFLNDVLDRHLGIPLTLCIVYLEVGWRLGLPLAGVNFPGHFVVRYEGEALRLLADPYQEGAIRFEEDAQGLLDRISQCPPLDDLAPFVKNLRGAKFDNFLPEDLLARQRKGATDEELLRYDEKAPMVVPPYPELTGID